MEIGTKAMLAQADSILAKIIATIPEPRTESTKDVFFDLMSCVLEQQIHYRSTKKIFQKMLEKASLKTLTLDNFPDFERAAFANANLAMSKYETIERILAFFTANKIDWSLLGDEEVEAKLKSIKGIGKWTIDMILLYTLERPTVFPYDDFHLKQIMVKLYGLDPAVKLKAQMIEVSAQWSGHKSLAVKYLLAYKEFNKTKK
jgi:DNA-3-methyladenine glycosylase II